MYSPIDITKLQKKDRLVYSEDESSLGTDYKDSKAYEIEQDYLQARGGDDRDGRPYSLEGSALIQHLPADEDPWSDKHKVEVFDIDQFNKDVLSKPRRTKSIKNARRRLMPH